MVHLFRVSVAWASLLLCSLFGVAPLWAANDSSTQLADVTIGKVEIRSVNATTGYAEILVQLELLGKANATVNKVELLKFYLDTVRLSLESNTQSFDLKAKQSAREDLIFETQLSPQMAALAQKFGKNVRVSGTAEFTAETHSLPWGKKTVTSEGLFDNQATLVTPDDTVMGALNKTPFFGTEASKPQSGKDAGRRDANDQPARDEKRHDPAAGSNGQFPEQWMTEMRQRGANNLVLIEASGGAGLAKLYRQGYRLTEREVIAPIDLRDPVKRDAGSLVSSIANSIPAAEMREVHYRAWPAETRAAIGSDDSTMPLRFKCKLGLGTPGADLGVFEFTSLPQKGWDAIATDTETLSVAPAIELSYTGFSDQSFSSATLSATQLSGSADDEIYQLSSHTSQLAFGSPVFSQHGLLAIVNGDGSAVRATKIQRALLSSSCTGVAVSAAKPDMQTSGYRVRFWSTPSGATVWVDGNLALDEMQRPITTAASKEECTERNTVLIHDSKSHHFSFIKEGYRPFAGNVNVDDDMTLGGTLTKASR